MPKLPILSSKNVIRILTRLGFEPAPKRGKGSHSALLKGIWKGSQIEL